MLALEDRIKELTGSLAHADYPFAARNTSSSPFLSRETAYEEWHGSEDENDVSRLKETLNAKERTLAETHQKVSLLERECELHVCLLIIPTFAHP